MIKLRVRVLAFLGVLALAGGMLPAAEMTAVPGRWSEEKVNAWYAQEAWPVGANYVPRTAINQLEMWQADTFDLPAIDQEFGWAADIGMNVMRVFLHDLLWQQDSAGLLRRMEQFLKVAEKHRIKVLFVFFDGVWDPHPFSGKQRPPRPFVHNSGWVQSPGREILRDPARLDALKPYVQGVLSHFKNDARIFGWDLFNEPDNPNPDAYVKLELPNKHDAALVLLEKSFGWAREVNPSQPLTAGIWLDYQGWKKNPPIYQCMLANSDFITFHNYAGPDDMAREVAELKAAYNRPLVCTEYMARGNKSTFDPILGNLKGDKVGAINWGLVDGKSQTIYPWETWGKIYTGEPEIWHHDVFRADGSPYRKAETDYIRGLTKPNAARQGAK
jgi:hypothetical protein